MYIHFAAMIAGAFKGLLERVLCFLEQDAQSQRPIIEHYAAYRWCDSTERALSNELMGRGSWLGGRHQASR